MQFGRSRFPVPFPCPPCPLCHYAALLLPFSFRNLWLPFGIYCMSNYLLATGLVPVPVPFPLPLAPLPLSATVLIFDMTNVRRLIRPQTTRSSPKEANLLRCTALRSGNRSHVLITRKGGCPAMPRPLLVTCIQHLLFSAWTGPLYVVLGAKLIRLPPSRSPSLFLSGIT